MVRNILGAVAGIIAGFAAVFLSQMLVNLVYPLPAGVDVFNREQMTEVFRNLPSAHFAAILVTYLVGGLIGGLVARFIAYAGWPVWVAPVLIALAAALNVFSYPHPVWAQIGAIVAPLVGGWLASRMVKRRTAPEPERVDAEV